MLVYNVETLRTPEEISPDNPNQGWQHPMLMGFGSAVVYDYSTDLYHCIITQERERLVRMLSLGVPPCTASRQVVVSFNGIKFDNKVTLDCDCQDNMDLPTPWRNYDILLEIVKAKFQCQNVREAEKELGAVIVHDGSIGLDGLAQGTLGMGKTGHGSKSPLLIREGRWGDLFAYNLHDVRLTRKLMDFLMRYGYLIDRGGFKIEIVVPEWVKMDYYGHGCQCDIQLPDVCVMQQTTKGGSCSG
jgi:hypothetical protein